MFLRKIELENVRGIRHLDLSFTRGDSEIRQWTLVLGQNGTGKSTILQAIVLVFAGRDALPELIGSDPDSWIRHGSDTCSIRAEILTKQGEVLSVALGFRRGQAMNGILDANRESMAVLDDVSRTVAHEHLIIGYGASRHLSDPMYPGSQQGDVFSDTRANNVATLFVGDATLVPVEFWNLDHQRSEVVLEVLREVCRELLPGVELRKLDREKRQLLFDTPNGILPLHLLGDGFQNVIAWFADLIYRATQVCKDHRNPLDIGGLLMLDEVDLHQHPVWQRNLIYFLSKTMPNFQVVATTNSPFTTQQADAGELSVLRRGDEGYYLEVFNGPPKKLLLHQLAMSWIFGDLPMSSRELELQRARYRELKARNEKTTGELAELDQLKEMLADHPDWRRALIPEPKPTSTDLEAWASDQAAAALIQMK